MTPLSVQEIHEGNRAAWNEAAHHYRLELEDTIRFIAAGKSALLPAETDLLGPLDRCERAIHLQCASGKDTLSLWNLGAREVIGVDISDRHIENARLLSGAVRAPARWFCTDILEVDPALNGTADVVYTGQGALTWLFDIRAWGAVVARLLKPGGHVVVFDTHPVEWLFDETQPGWVISKHSYFDGCLETQGWPVEYLAALEEADEKQARKRNRAWPLAEIVMALIDAGLRLEVIREHRDVYWDSFPKVPAAAQGQVPRTFSLRARRPLSEASCAP